MCTPSLREQLARNNSHRGAGGSFPGTGAFEHVAKVAAVVLEPRREVRVARAGTRDRRAPGARQLFVRRRIHTHRVLPVRPIAVRNEQSDGAADGLTQAHATHDFGGVLFNGHAAAATITALPSGEVNGEICG
jgi:hypothetical protein